MFYAINRRVLKKASTYSDIPINISLELSRVKYYLFKHFKSMIIIVFF